MLDCRWFVNTKVSVMLLLSKEGGQFWREERKEGKRQTIQKEQKGEGKEEFRSNNAIDTFERQERC